MGSGPRQPYRRNGAERSALTAGSATGFAPSGQASSVFALLAVVAYPLAYLSGLLEAAQPFADVAASSALFFICAAGMAAGLVGREEYRIVPALSLWAAPAGGVYVSVAVALCAAFFMGGPRAGTGADRNGAGPAHPARTALGLAALLGIGWAVSRGIHGYAGAPV